MTGHGEKLSRKETLAVAALLTEPSVAAAATAAGIGEATLRRWLRRPAFLQAFRAAKQELLERTLAGLLRIGDKAVSVLERNYECGKPSVEVRAALGVLNQITRYKELLELEERVAALEHQLERR